MKSCGSLPAYCPAPWRRTLSASLLAALVAAGCSGTIPGGSEPGGEDEPSDEEPGAEGTGGASNPGKPPVAAACSARTGRPAWQLSTNTAFQTRMIVAQVFGETVLRDAQVTAMLETLPSNQKAKGFDTENKAIATQFVDGYVALAGRLGALAAEQTPVRQAIETFVGKACGQSLDLQSECGRDFASRFVGVLERAPASDDELKLLLDSHKEIATKYGAQKAYAAFVASVLTGPKSAMRFDAAELDGKGTVDARTFGARLAMTLTGGLPDGQLRAKIEDRSILEDATAKEEAKRLLRTPAGRETMQHFAQQWLNVLELKSPPGAPGFVPTREDSAAMAKAARLEIGRLFEATMLDKGGKLRDFFGTSEVVPAHEWLAKLYDAPKADKPAAARASDRRGLLTRVAFNLHGDFAPYLPLAHRGYGVKVTMLCGTIGALPDMVDTTLPNDAPDAMSSRQFFEILTERGSCKGCHAAMNPYGYAMSAYSVTGERLGKETVKNRKTDAMEDVEIRESVGLTMDGRERMVTSASDLSAALGESAQAHACFAHRFDQYAVGKQEDFLCDGDVEAKASDLSLEDTVLAYVTSSAFRAR